MINKVLATMAIYIAGLWAMPTLVVGAGLSPTMSFVGSIQSTSSSSLLSEEVVIVEHTGTLTESSICLGSVLSQIDGKTLGLSISNYLTPDGIYNYEIKPDTPGVIGLSLDSAGPFTPTLLVPIVVLNGYGAKRFYVETQSSGSTNIHAPCEVDGKSSCMYWYDVNTGSYSATDWLLTTAAVDDVFFTSDESPLSTNPNVGGGSRVYPGRATPDAPEVQNKVAVYASTTAPDLEVWFKVFDVDDPSSDSRPIDPKGSAGDDNFGCCASVSPISVQSNISNGATTTLTVTMQPGDNFKVAASCDLRRLNDLTVQGTDLVTADGQPPEHVQITDLLTVWRKLHIEVDSMGSFSQSDNILIGNIAQVIPDSNKVAQGQTLELNGIFGLEKNRYKGGVICLVQDKELQVPFDPDCKLFENIDYFWPDLACYKILYNNKGKGAHAQGDVVYIDTALPVIPDGSTLNFFMVDDDDVDGNKCPDAIDLVDIPAPDLKYLTQGSDDSATNALAPAYVSPVYDLGLVDGEQTEVILNFAEDSMTAAIDAYSFDNSKYEADPDFWTIYLHGGYQWILAEDDDPNGEGATMGVATWEGGTILSEAVRDKEAQTGFPDLNAWTTVHEVGHLMGADHGDGAVMTDNNWAILFFADESLNSIRHLLHPGSDTGDPRKDAPDKESIVESGSTVPNGLGLTITTGDIEYTVGQKVDLTVRLKNYLKHSQRVRSVDVRDGYLLLFMSQNGGPFLRYKGPGWGLRDVFGGSEYSLSKGDMIEAELSVLYHRVPDTQPNTQEMVQEPYDPAVQNSIRTKYALESQGVYTLVALLVDPDGNTVVESNELQIAVEDPKGNDLAVWSVLKNKPEYGYFIQTGSPPWRSADPRTVALVEDLSDLVAVYPDSKYSKAISVALTKYSQYLASK
jgi:hypothetical protein